MVYCWTLHLAHAGDIRCSSAPALKAGSDHVTHGIRVLVDKTVKRLDPLYGDRLVLTFIQAPDDLVEVPPYGEQLIIGLAQGFDFGHAELWLMG